MMMMMVVVVVVVVVATFAIAYGFHDSHTFSPEPTRPDPTHVQLCFYRATLPGGPAKVKPLTFLLVTFECISKIQ